MTTTTATAAAQTATPATPAARPAKTEVRQPKALPAPNSDFYEVYETLSAEELATVKRVRAFMEAKVAPVITKYWVDDAFPFELLPAVKELGIGGLAMRGYGCAGEAWRCWALSRWRLPASTRRSRHSWACTPAWRWAPSTSTDRKSRSRSGCRRWRASRRSAALASQSRSWVRARPAAC
jgi:Acyl-CoA dehydrogenase, N-terminal domain